jgi:hypothetical protein
MLLTILDIYLTVQIKVPPYCMEHLMDECVSGLSGILILTYGNVVFLFIEVAIVIAEDAGLN